MFFVSILPGVFWVWYFYRKDIYDPEPKKLLVRDFLWGMVIVFPASFLEFPFRNLFSPDKSLLTILLASVLIVGFIEEGFKAGTVYFLHYNNPEFNEPIDGMIYGITVGLGFAAFENLLYTEVFGYSVGLSRAIITNLLHASFTGIFGFYLARFRTEVNFSRLVFGFLQVVIFHGIYNFLVLSQLVGNRAVFFIVILTQFYLAYLMKKLNLESPFRT
ncbi:MAG: PrsW family intramembrane metalloprotease [Halanaerobiaceae bacterium]